MKEHVVFMQIAVKSGIHVDCVTIERKPMKLTVSRFN